MVRVIERCSKQQDTEVHLENLKDKLEKRNYPEKLIKSKFALARNRTRANLIHQNRHEKNTDNAKVRLIFTYNQGNPPLHMWFREAKKCLIKDDRARALSENFQICYRQPKNLKSIAAKKVKKHIHEVDSGCSKCGKCRVSCPVIQEGGKFSSTNTKRTYPIKRKLNCDSCFVIYLATCKKCRGQYVGKSEPPFKRRHSNHKQEIKRKYGGLGHHYGGTGCGYENFSVQIIDQVEQGDKVALAEKEVYWQNQLRCYVQNGGQAHCYRKEK